MLNNRPFQQAISAIHGRPAYRQVDRRLVYIEPHPAPPVAARAAQGPGLLRDACAARCRTFRARSRSPTSSAGWSTSTTGCGGCAAIIDSARPQVSRLVAKVITSDFDRAIDDRTSCAPGASRSTITSRATPGFAYQAYVRLKLASVRAFGAQLIVKLRGVPPQSPLSRVVAEIIDAWAVRKGIVYERADSKALEFETAGPAHLPGWVRYLLAFDVKYRERRLHFLIEGQNRLYELLDQERFAGLDPLVVDRLKRDFYARLDALRRREERRISTAPRSASW